MNAMTQIAAPRARKAKPTVRERVADRVCPNCGKPSAERRSTRGPAPIYCSPECKRELNNRNLKDGLALVPYLKAWRIDRGSGEIATRSFERICKIVDELNEADRRDERPRADYHAATLLASNAAPVNELRYGRRKVAETRAREAAERGVMVEDEAEIVEAPVPTELPDLTAILQAIADGHNDARGLAAQALSQIGR